MSLAGSAPWGRLFAGTLALLFLALPSPKPRAQAEIGAGETVSLSWGGVEAGWEDIHLLENTRTRRGPMGELGVVLQDDAPVRGEDIELLLDFESCRRDSLEADFTFFKPGEVRIHPSDRISRFGSCAAGFMHRSHRVELVPGEGSLLRRDPLESFTIDFFLHPVQVSEGDVVLSWRAPTVDAGGEFSGFVASFSGRKLYWRFDRVFRRPDGEAVEVVVGELQETPVNRWSHHALTYDADRGLLSLYQDGRENAIRWLTHTGTQGGTLLRGAFSRYITVPLVLGAAYTGYLDELRIARGVLDFPLDSYRSRGAVVSGVLDLRHRGTTLAAARWQSEEERGTAVRLFCRMSTRYFGPDDGRPEAPAWVPVANGRAPEEPLKGRYLQWKAELYSTTGDYTPVLHTLTLELEPDSPPVPPVFLEARPLDEGALLRWVRNKEPDIAGYRVYYGEESRFYFGTGAAQGDSPFFVPDPGLPGTWEVKVR
ncbi:MAG: LamG-like jellyroll fold domain-containing protein, partial [Spirochaetota bacterium]